ncbi:MAG: CinA family protein [Spirochaetes bacterium]|nr:CinA family protein [Spirochaetota bacterium]
MLFCKKIRFFIIAQAFLESMCGQKKIPDLEYKIIADEFGLILELCSKKEENIEKFIFSLPEELMFFHSSSIDLSVSDMAAEALKRSGAKLAVVESCTGGLISKIVTDKPGSSDYFWGGFITYDNKAKETIDVPAFIIEKYGSVSKETAISMAEKGLEKSGADICASVSGIAGPGGGTVDKPVGTVWIAVKRDIVKTFLFLFSGTRKEIRDKTAQAALLIVYKELLYCKALDSIVFEHYI